MRKPQVFLQHAVVDVLDGLEPGHARVVDVVRLVVEDGQFVDLADDFAEVDVAVGGLADGFWPERRKEIVAQVVVFERRLVQFAEKDTVDVGQEDIAGRPDNAHVVLNVQRDLEVVAPVLAVVAVVGQHRVVEEDAQPVEIGAKAVQHDDVGGDEQEVAGKGRNPVRRACGNSSRRSAATGLWFCPRRLPS